MGPTTTTCLDNFREQIRDDGHMRQQHFQLALTLEHVRLAAVHVDNAERSDWGPAGLLHVARPDERNRDEAPDVFELVLEVRINLADDLFTDPLLSSELADPVCVF